MTAYCQEELSQLVEDLYPLSSIVIEGLHVMLREIPESKQPPDEHDVSTIAQTLGIPIC